MNTPLIDISPKDLRIVCNILDQHVPEYEVWAFGSRAKWASKEYSDLDLAVITEKPLSLTLSAKLENDFSESRLPFKVDVVDWAVTSPSFREIIERDKVVVKKAGNTTHASLAGEWRETTLGAVVDFLSGGTPSKDNANYWHGSIPWVSAKDMKQLFLDDAEDHLTEEGLGNGSKLVPKDTVLLLTRGMTLLNDVPICIARRPMAFNQDVKALRPKEGVDSAFLPYLLLGHKHRLLDLVDLAGHGTGRLNTDELKALELLLPSEPEQRAIAKILDALDSKIELNRRTNETLETIARALFKSWFVDFDPVRAKSEGRDTGLPKHVADLFPDSFEDSTRGEIPSGWEVRGVDEIAYFRNGLALQKYPPKEGRSLPVIKIAQLRAGNTINADAASADLDTDYIVQDGDVLFSWSGSLECVIWAGGPGALNQHLFKVTSTDYPKWFYYLWIHRHLPDFRHIAAGKATTMGHIQRHHLTDAKVIVPPQTVLREFDRTFGSLINELSLKSVECRTLSSLRDALLPRLISGELRVKDVERLAAGYA